MTDRRPVAIMADAFQFTLEVERTQEEKDDMRLAFDDGTIQRFQRWAADNDIFAFRGTSSGPGFYHATYPAEHAEVIRAWIAAEGLDT